MKRYTIEKTRIVKVTETYEVFAPSPEYAKLSMREYSPINVDQEVIGTDTHVLAEEQMEEEVVA